MLFREVDSEPRSTRDQRRRALVKYDPGAFRKTSGSLTQFSTAENVPSTSPPIQSVIDVPRHQEASSCIVVGFTCTRAHTHKEIQKQKRKGQRHGKICGIAPTLIASSVLDLETLDQHQNFVQRNEKPSPSFRGCGQITGLRILRCFRSDVPRRGKKTKRPRNEKKVISYQRKQRCVASPLHPLRTLPLSETRRSGPSLPNAACTGLFLPLFFLSLRSSSALTLSLTTTSRST